MVGKSLGKWAIPFLATAGSMFFVNQETNAQTVEKDLVNDKAKTEVVKDTVPTTHTEFSINLDQDVTVEKDSVQKDPLLEKYPVLLAKNPEIRPYLEWAEKRKVDVVDCNKMVGEENIFNFKTVTKQSRVEFETKEMIAISKDVSNDQTLFEVRAYEAKGEIPQNYNEKNGKLLKKSSGVVPVAITMKSNGNVAGYGLTAKDKTSFGMLSPENVTRFIEANTKPNMIERLVQETLHYSKGNEDLRHNDVHISRDAVNFMKTYKAGEFTTVQENREDITGKRPNSNNSPNHNLVNKK